jgi:Uma2 family endonuclease
MTAAALDLPVLRTVDDFLAWAEARPERWQFIDGALVMMAGAADPHVIIATNVTVELGNRLRGSPCRPFGSDRLVRAGTRNGFYPDVSVSCRGEDGSFASEPVLVVEVLSDSTERYDRGAKWRAYQRLPSLQHYLLIEPGEPLAELWTRTPEGWRYESLDGLTGTIELTGLGIALPLAAVYEDVAFPAPAAAG